MADYIKPVIFRLGNQQFGVDINLVQSIEREINIVRVPNAMKYISGIVNLRGEVIPAFSLRKKFGTDDNVGVIGEDSTVIVNIPGVVKLALEVDEVLEIGDIDAQSIVQMPALRRLLIQNILTGLPMLMDSLLFFLMLKNYLRSQKQRVLRNSQKI